MKLHARSPAPSNEQRAQQHFAHAYCSTRSDLETSAGGGAEGGGSRPCGGGVILWERALLAWGLGYLLETQLVRVRKTRTGHLMRRQPRVCCPPAAAARPPWPQAATAALKWQRAQHNAASLVRNRPTPSGSPESPRAAGRSPRLQTAGRPGAQRTRPGLSAARCRRRAQYVQVPPRLLRPVVGTCAAAATCAPDCSGRWEAGEGRESVKGCACGRCSGRNAWPRDA